MNKSEASRAIELLEESRKLLAEAIEDFKNNKLGVIHYSNGTYLVVDHGADAPGQLNIVDQGLVADHIEKVKKLVTSAELLVDKESRRVFRKSYEDIRDTASHYGYWEDR